MTKTTVTLTVTKGNSTTDHTARSVLQARKLYDGLVAAGLAERAVVYVNDEPYAAWTT